MFLDLPVEPLPEPFLVLDLFVYLVGAYLHFFEDVGFVVFSLDLNGLIDHFAQLLVPLVQLKVSLNKGLVLGSVRFVLVLQLINP